MASLAILLLLARISSSIAISSNHYISRSSQQLIIASAAPLLVPDADGQIAQQPFLTSPSGSYVAYLRRAADSAGGLAGDACYVQIQQAGGGAGSVWESDCTPVGGADACDLAFSTVGLELFAGGHSLWDTGVDADPATLSLDDHGDMSIASTEGVTVWKASGEPWTGQQCGAAPVPAWSTSSPSTDALPPLAAATSTKLVTPPATSLASTTTTGSSDLSLGDQLAPPPPVDDTVTAPDSPAQPPVDTVPEQPLAPPPADVSPDLPDPSLPKPPAYTSPESPDLPLVSPPPTDVSPDLPLYSSPPPAPALPPFGIPLVPPPGASETSPDTPLPGAGATTPPANGAPGSPGGVPFSPVGAPHKQGSLHHDLPDGASPPLPDTLGPSGHGEGAGIPDGHGQPQKGVFGQQPPLVDGEGHPLPLEESAGGWSRREHGRVVMGAVLAALFALCSGF